MRETSGRVSPSINHRDCCCGRSTRPFTCWFIPAFSARLTGSAQGQGHSHCAPRPRSEAGPRARKTITPPNPALGGCKGSVFPGTQRGLPAPPGVDTDEPLVGAGPGGPSKHATTPPIWGLPGPLGASAPPQSAAVRRPRFLLGGGTGAHAGRTGSLDPPSPQRNTTFQLSSPCRSVSRCSGSTPGRRRPSSCTNAIMYKCAPLS